MITCPDCAESVKEGAGKCPHCGYDFSPPPSQDPAASTAPQKEVAEPVTTGGLGVGGGCAGAGCGCLPLVIVGLLVAFFFMGGPTNVVKQSACGWVGLGCDAMIRDTISDLRTAATEGDFDRACELMSGDLRERVAVAQADCPSVLAAGDPITRLLLSVGAVESIERQDDDALDGIGETARAEIRGGGSVDLIGVLQFGGGIRWELDGVNP